MGLFSFTQEIAMDLGTANTIIITNGKIVVDEPSVVALDRRTEKMIAVGEKAKLMHEKTHENIRTIRPLSDCRLLCLRAEDARFDKAGEYSQPFVFTFSSHGDWRSFGKYGS